MRASPGPRPALTPTEPTAWSAVLLAWLVLAAVLGAVPRPSGGAEPNAAPGRGIISREADLLPRPYALGRPIARLSSGTPVAVLERRGYWLRVRADEPPSEGWVRLIRVRYETRSEAAAPARAPDGGSESLFSSLARGATGWLGRRSGPPRETSTVGIRGLSAEDLSTAAPDANALQRLEQVAASPDAARAFAESGALEANRIVMPEAEERSPAPGGSGDERLDSRM